MSSTLIDAASFPLYSDVDVSAILPGRFTALCQIAHRLCSAELDSDPAVQLHADEEGLVALPTTGRDALQVVFRLKNKPLLSKSPVDVFSALALTFPAPYPNQEILNNLVANPTVATISLKQDTGLVRLPWLGLGGLPTLMFQYASSINNAGPTGYLASYVAGYAITPADQAAYPTAPTVPADLQQAAAWIIEVLLGQAKRVSQDVQNAISGVMAGFSNLEYKETYHNPQIDLSDLGNQILAGTQQGMWAKGALSYYKKSDASRVWLV